MSLLTRIRARAGGGLVRTRTGAAVVVHTTEGITDDARVLAAALPADPEHELIVADLPSVSSVEVWKTFAATLPRGRRPVRVVPGREPREVAPYVWQWLADRTGRTVVAPYGTAHHVPTAVFVHSDEHSGWASYRRGAAPAWAGKRFPRPSWDLAEVGRHRTAGFRGVAEPVPAGIWLRPDVGEGALAAGRAKLARTLPCLPEAPLIVLGAPDELPLELADIAAFWRTLPPPVAAAARFVRFGEVGLPDGATLWQELADVLATEVWCYTGIPTGTPDALEVLALRPDGSLGWHTFAQAVACRPRGAGATRVCAYRAPVTELEEVAPGVYRYGQDAVVEVVGAGLWIRPADQTTDPAGVRAVPLDPVHTLLLYEATVDTDLRAVAEAVAARLDDATRRTTMLTPTTALAATIAPATALPSTTRSSGTAEDGAVPPAVVPAQAGPGPSGPAPGADDPHGTDTDLPWLSRLMETVSMPAPVRRPVRPSEAGSADDRAAS